MLKNKIKYGFLLLFLGGNTITYTQQAYIETGFSNAFFKDYVNNLGENTLDNSLKKPKTPFIESGFRFNIYKERIHFNIGANYNAYKINTAFSSGNLITPLSYDLSYVALKAGIQLSILKWQNFKLQLNAHVSHDWLTSGTNSYNNIVVDIYKDRTLDRTLVRYYKGGALEYEISKTMALYLKYSIGNSIKEENKDSQDGESYSLETKSLSIGLLFNIKNHRRQELHCF